ncbi:spore coat protein SA [Abditibacteriota bacterium]|nr:spore coat protein SA [Abditibacteriota bacterium]
MTVLFFDHTARMGGGEISLFNLVTHVDRSKIEPVVVLASDGELRERLRAAGIEVHVLRLDESVTEVRKDSLSSTRAVSFAQVSQIARYIWRLRGFMRARGAEIVHANSLKADLIAAVAARLCGVPVIWHVRDRIADDYLPPLATRVFRLLCRVLPNFVIVNSNATLATLEIPRQRRARVIYNGVVHDGLPPEEFEEDPRSLRGRPQPNQNGAAANATTVTPITVPSEKGTQRREAELLIGLVGRISPWKGQDIFLRAADEVIKKFPRARFQIIGAPLFGEEDYEKEIRDLCDELELNDNVEWLGFRRDVPQLISKLDLLVHASKTGEPFGQVVVEAMMASKPVVATAGGGIPEIVLDGQTGYLVPMNDAPAMADAIVRVLDDASNAQKMGERGRKRAREHFAIGRTANKISRVYDHLLVSQSNWRRRKRSLRSTSLGFVLGVFATLWWLKRRL